MENIVIATIKSWNIENAKKLREIYEDKYNIILINDKSDLNLSVIEDINPRYIFFPHWSWKILKEIHEKYECILFHMTDLPFGRGGSPLQNLIIRKIYHTKISAIRVREELDSGEIYLKRDLFIGLGSAEEIFILASNIIFFDMIPAILENNIIPSQQEGEPIFFKRRTPEESDLGKYNFENIQEIYDFIRMLDAEGYPNAFLKLGNFKFIFSEVHRKSNRLMGRFEVLYDEENSDHSSTSR